MRKTFTYNGKRYEVTANNQHDLDEKYFKKRYELEFCQCKYTVEEWCLIWLEKYKKNSINETNYRHYRIRINKYILPVIGKKKLDEVKLIDCQMVVNSSSGLSATYINKVAGCLKAIFESAVKEELIQINPARHIVPPKGKTFVRRSLTDSETDIFLRTIPTSEHGLYFSLMFYCGLRPYECSFIQGKDIDNGTLHIRGTKNKNADRYVPIPQNLNFPKLNRNEYLFPNLTETKRKRWWRVFKRELNINAGCKVYRNKVIPPFVFDDEITPYCFRHTFCTNLEKAGVPINIARQLMGHSSVEITARIYTHTSNSEINKACEKMNEYYNTAFPQAQTK